MVNKSNTIEGIREFNRYFTVLMGFLNKRYLNTNFSITEIRVLYDLHLSNGTTANQLITQLNIDKSYLSRILKKFEKENLIIKQISSKDKRYQQLYLTPEGMQQVEYLIKITNQQIADLVEPLNSEQCDEVTSAMKVIMKNLNN